MLGKTCPHTFQFHVNETGHALIESLSATSWDEALEKAESLAFRWINIKDSRPKYQTIAIIDDKGKKGALWEDISKKVLKEFSDKVLEWTEIEKTKHRRLVEALKGHMS